MLDLFRVVSYPLRQPTPRDGTLGLLEDAQGGQAGWGRLQGRPGEEACHQRDDGGDCLGQRGVARWMAGEEGRRIGAALHRDAGREEDDVDPGRTDAGVRPIDHHDALGRQQQIVRA